MLAEGDARKSLAGAGGESGFVQDVIATIADNLNIKFGKKYENLLDAIELCPDAKFYKLNTFSETRFAGYSHKVLHGFLKDIPFIIVSLENRSLEQTGH